MSTFQLIIVILATVYVVFELYFAISGRILHARQKKLDNEYAEQTLQWEDQVKALTLRISEVSSENNRLNGVVREWMEYGNSLKVENDKLKKSEEEWMRQSEDYKAKYLDVVDKLKVFTTAAGPAA